MPNRTKPISLKRAVACVWVSVGLVAILTVISWLGLLDIPSGVGVTITNTITAGLLVFVSVKLGSGRNWARWLFTVVYALGSLVMILSLILASQIYFSSPAVLQVSGIVQLILQTAALVLVFTPTSGEWFRAQKENRKSAL